MFYSIKESAKASIPLEEITEDKIVVGYLDYEEFKNCYKQFGFSETTVNECVTETANFCNSIEVYDDYSFCIMNVIEPEDLYAKRDRIALFIKKNLFLVIKIVDCDDSIKQIFQYAIEKMDRFKPENMTLEKGIYVFVEGLMSGDNKVLENIGKTITELEEQMLNGAAGNAFNIRLFEKRKDLVLYRSYYEQLIDIGEELQDNENGIFCDRNLRYFKIFTTKAQRLCDNTHILMDNLIHLREAYDAQLEYNQNRIMKFFTAITTIFLPLTLIAGWFGMNFTNMPELKWRYGYPMVIAISLVIIILCIIYFRKKKFL